MKAGLKSDSLAPLHYFSVVHESIAWSSCSSAELASSLIHEAKLTLSSLNLLLLKTKTLHFVLESTMQSNYHNLPMINGVPQKFGQEYKATNTVCNEKKRMFSTDIATAYPAEAKVKSWVRSYALDDKNSLLVIIIRWMRLLLLIK